jgi:type VI secretion system ImpH/TssG family protein
VSGAWQRADFAATPWTYDLAAAWRLLGPTTTLRPALSLDFPPGEIRAAQQAADGSWTLTIGLAGLYGHGSPLPLVDTEELIAEGADSLRRGLLDLLAGHLLRLEAEALDQTRAGADLARRLGLLSGLDQRELAAGLAADGLLAYAGLLSGRGRTAGGLARMLSHWAELPCAVEPCSTLWTTLPETEQSRLGSTRLDVDAVAGSAVCSRATSFTITVGPVAWTAAEPWLPGGERLAALCALTGMVNRDAHAFAVHLVIADGGMPSFALGCGRLGFDQRLSGEPSGLRTELVFSSAGGEHL